MLGAREGYVWRKQMRPRQLVVMVQSVRKLYGEQDGDGGFNGENERCQDRGIKMVLARHKKRRNQSLTTFVLANRSIFLAHVGGCAVWWGWML